MENTQEPQAPPTQVLLFCVFALKFKYSCFGFRHLMRNTREEDRVTGSEARSAVGRGRPVRRVPWEVDATPGHAGEAGPAEPGRGQTSWG